MKKAVVCIWILSLALLGLTCCGTGPAENGGGAAASVAGTVEAPLAEEAGDPALWPYSDMPVKVRYDRMWEYSDYAESEDQQVIDGLVAAIKDLNIGEPVEYAVDDYTDILTFTFSDGRTCRLEFEENNWVTDTDERYHVDGLDKLRSQLDDLLG